MWVKLNFVDDIKEILSITSKMCQLIRTGVTRIGSLTDTKVAGYARIVLTHSLRHYPRSPKEQILLGIFFGQRRVNPLPQLIPRQPHSSPRRWETPQLSSHRHPNVRETHRREHVYPHLTHS